jgi:2-C-methyl-D-erythritol 4-phosphate cytidylyltransferase/2-C-methyl-D-erythritol 2,4-cyclodiphosphate synthase
MSAGFRGIRMPMWACTPSPTRSTARWPKGISARISRPPTRSGRARESHIFLTHAVDLATRKGFTITHVRPDAVCERPKIGPHAAAMRAALAGLLRIEVDRVSVKATTTERLGFTGREEGIAALATVTLVRP